MAQLFFPLMGGAAGELPFPVEQVVRDKALARPEVGFLANDFTLLSGEQGALGIGSATLDKWSQVPICLGLLPDNFEVLTRYRKLATGTVAWTNGAGGIALVDSGYDGDFNPAYTLFTGSNSSASTVQSLKRDSAGTQTVLATATKDTGQNWAYMRVRRSGATLQVRVWMESEAEPASWLLSSSDSLFQATGVILVIPGKGIIAQYSWVSIATGGATAAMLAPVRTLTGTHPHPSAQARVELRHAPTGCLMSTVTPDPATGAWSEDLYTSDQALISYYSPGYRTEVLEETLGAGYLAGKVKLNGDGPALVRVHYRPVQGAPGDGHLVTQVETDANGLWVASGLDPTKKYDVISRRPLFNDVISAAVMPALDQLTAMGSFSLGTPANTLQGVVTVYGGYAPYTVSVDSGSAPPGVTFSASGNQVSAGGASTASGDFTWVLKIQDSLGKSVLVNCSVTGVIAGDPYWAGVVSLLHFDGVSGATTFPDATGKTWTRSGSAAIATDNSLFGGASGYFTASYIEAAASADWAFGTGDFTVEFWMRNTDLGTGGYWDAPLGNWSASSGWCFFVKPDGSLAFHTNGNGLSTGAGVVAANVGCRVAVSRVAGTLYLFKDGVLVASGANTDNLSRTDSPRVGTNRTGSTDDFEGWIDEVRITKGVGRYTANYTPDTREFSGY